MLTDNIVDMFPNSLKSVSLKQSNGYNTEPYGISFVFSGKCDCNFIQSDSLETSEKINLRL